MLNHEDVITRILSLHPDLTRDTIMNMINKKREDAGRLLTMDGAAYIVANELDLNLSDEVTLKTKIKITDLIVGSNDVSVAGDVRTVYPVTTFTRNDGREGQVARFVISDETGTIAVVLWDEKAEIINQGKVSPNQNIRVEHGYVKIGLNGRPELNIGQRGDVIILSSKSSTKRSGKIGQGFKKIRNITEDDYSINLVGVVLSTSPVTVFTKKDKSKGQVMRIRIADETGRIRLVLWDEKVNQVKKVKKNQYLRITDGQLRKGLGDVSEVHVGRFSQVMILPKVTKEIGLPSFIPIKIDRLTPTMSDVDILGRVVSVGTSREFSRRSGGVGRIGDLFLLDETGTIRLSLWDEQVDILDKISVGDILLVGGAYTRERFGSIGLNLGKMGTLTINPDMKEAKTLPIISKEATPIGQLKIGLTSIIEGTISEAPSVRLITTKDGRDLNVASLRLKDATGEIQASLWRELANTVEELPVGTRLQIRNGFIRIGFNGNLELSSRSITEIEVHKNGNGEQLTTLFDREPELSAFQKISDLKEGDKASVEGKIIEVIPNSKVYAACPKCRRRINEAEDGWVCERCGEIPEPIYRMFINIFLEDDSGKIKAIFWSPLAEKLLNVELESTWKKVIESGDETTPIEEMSKALIGKELKLTGRVNTDLYQGGLRLTVDTFE
jgi:replication factor A1